MLHENKKYIKVACWWSWDTKQTLGQKGGPNAKVIPQLVTLEIYIYIILIQKTDPPGKQT